MKQIAFLCVLMFAPAAFAQAFSGGSGTAADPYLIATKGDLKSLSEDTLYANGHFLQTADIAFEAADFDSGGAFFNRGRGFSPIGKSYYSQNYNRGVFRGAYDGGNHSISGLRIRTDTSVAGFFGYVEKPALIQNVKLIDVDISGPGNAGGLVVYNGGGTIVNCSVTGTVTGVNGAGGLVAYNNGSISGCRAAVTVKGGTEVGGLVGWDQGMTALSSATGKVSGRYNVGGLAGKCACNLSASSATGDVEGDHAVGGLAGWVDSGGLFWSGQNQIRSGQVIRSSASGNVTGKYAAGGLAGLNLGRIDSSSASGRVRADSLLGGLVGDNGGDLLEDSAAGGAEGQAHVGGLAGRSNDTVMQCFAGGDVRGKDQVGGLIGNTGVSNPSGASNGYKDDTFIRNCGARGNVFGETKVGGLVGEIYGHMTASSVQGSYAYGTVIGKERVGGLIGYMQYGRISDSYAMGTVQGRYEAGGLIGENYSSYALQRCYAAGLVMGAIDFGGLVGDNLDRGNDGPTSFWDVEASGAARSDGGTAKSSVEMKTRSTFTDSGWDFDKVWAVSGSRNAGYPFLQWEKLPKRPEVQTLRLTAIRNADMTAMGRITCTGSGPVSAHGFVWNMAGAPERGKDFEKDLGAAESPRSFSFVIPNLSPDTRYHVRAFAVNAEGISYGGEFTESTVPYEGSGSERDPYRISSPRDLKYLSENDSGVAWPHLHYMLARDIALSASDFAAGGAFDNAGQGFIPLGAKWKQAFVAAFDGAGHAISGLRINRPDSSRQGFIYVAGPTSIRNLALTDIRVAGSDYVGGLIGFNNGAAVAQCVVAGTITGRDRVGGLIGLHDAGAVSSCGSRADVTGKSNVGGLLGDASGAIGNSYATGNVEGDTAVGGFVGTTERGSTRISGCSAAGKVSGRATVGGFVGENGSDTLTDSYSRGSVTGRTKVGGFAGENAREIRRAYATGKLTGGSLFGGFVGSSPMGTVIDCFWDIESSQEDLSPKGAGKTTAQMKNAATFTRKNAADLTEAWDFAGNPNDDTAHGDIWALSDSLNDGYPYLTGLRNIPLAAVPRPARNPPGAAEVRIHPGDNGLTLETGFESVAELYLRDGLGRIALALRSPKGRSHAFAWRTGGRVHALAPGRYFARLRVDAETGSRWETTLPITVR